MYCDLQCLWVRDKVLRVENIFGFVELYCDLYGIRVEFEGLVVIVDDEEIRFFFKFVQNLVIFIFWFLWVVLENDGKGLFEKNLFELLDFLSIYSKW